MDNPSTIIMLSLFMKTILWRRGQSFQNKEVKLHWSDVHLATVHDYFINLYPSCDFTNVRFARLFNVMFSYGGPGSSRIHAKIAASFAHELHGFFRVPRLKLFVDEERCIKKHQLVQVFLNFLIELLYFRSESFAGYDIQIANLKKELRLLLTILGDKSSTLYVDEHEEESQNLMAEFEAVANNSGILIHSLLFSTTRRSSGEMNTRFAFVLNHIIFLQYIVMRFLTLFPCISKPAYSTPETFLVDSFILDSLIHDLEDLISREDDLIAYVKDQLKVLHQGFTFLQSSIKDAGQRRLSEIGELKEAQKRIGNMAHQTEYLVISFLSGDAPLWYVINRLTNIGQKIELIGTELQEITKKHALGNLKVAKYFNTQLSLNDKGNIEIKDIIVDFENVREKDVLDYLIGGRESVQVISIFGMPGLGKTTLANKLFNHPSVGAHFDIKVWSVVSQNYQRQSILADLLIQINGEYGKDSTSTMDSKSLIVQIHQTLYKRRYLIVMDDVWDSNLWDDLIGCLRDDGNGSRVLFTTRNKDVGPRDCKNYALSSLSNEECWELLEKKVFGNNTCPPQLVGMGKKIAAGCGGLPLTVVAIAGILSTVDKMDFIWDEVRRNLASYVFDGGDNSVMHILELSYMHLPEHLKLCFLYFRAFARHKEVPVGKLMRLWISEGFIHKEQGKSAEDVAEECLLELIDKNLVMVAKRRSDGGVKTCVLHDLFHDLCFIKCEEENFLKIEENDIYSVCENGLHHRQTLEQYIYWVKRQDFPSRSLSFHLPGTSTRSISSVYKDRHYHTLDSKYYKTWSYCQQVRSLHVECQRSDFYIGRMRSLRVLHFNYISRYLIGFEYLVNLRYLVIRDLHAAIGSLGNLEYLRVETQLVVYLPPAILRMMKLKYLNARCARYGRNCNTSETNNLEFLSCIFIMELKDEEMLKCSPNLRKLKCEILSGRTSSNFDLSFLSRLQSLKLGLYVPGVTEISFPSNIKKLSLYGKQNLPWGMMSVIGNLENLEILKLGMTGFEGDVWETGENEFQKLKFLKLELLEGLIEWNVDSSGHFPALRQLVLSGCKNLLGIPCEIGEIATLEMIEIKGQCKKSLVKSAKLIKQQKKAMEGEDLPVLVYGKLISLLSPSPSQSSESESESETQA